MPVSGVRSWCDAFALNERSRSTSSPSRSAVASSALAASSSSGIPVRSVRTLKSPMPSRPTATASCSTGLERCRASSRAATAAINRITKANAAMSSQARASPPSNWLLGTAARTAPRTPSAPNSGVATTSSPSRLARFGSPARARRTASSARGGPFPETRTPRAS